MSVNKGSTSPSGWSTRVDFAARLRALMDTRGMGVRALARTVPCDPALISRLASGKQQPSRAIVQRLDDVLQSGGELAGLAFRPSPALGLVPDVAADDEIAALELARRAAASDVGPFRIASGRAAPAAAGCCRTA